MTNDFQKSGDFRLKGWHVLAAFIAFFGVIIAVNLTMATLASKSWTGLIVKNSYVASQQYNEKLEAAEAQRKLGWSSKILYKDNHLVIVMQDKAGSVLELDEITVKIGRPAFEQKDQMLNMLALGAGSYVNEIPLKDGEWAIEVYGKKGDSTYRRDARILVNGNKASVLE
jgi:nitrogen fixation protein FixH